MWEINSLFLKQSIILFILTMWSGVVLGQHSIQIGNVTYLDATALTGGFAGAENVSSLPSGSVTIQEKNICPSSWNGGYLYGIQQFLSLFTNGIYQNGTIYAQWPAATPPGATSTSTGSSISQFISGEPGQTFPEFGKTVTFNNLFTPGVYVYAMTCYYNNCSIDGQTQSCEWNAPSYWVGINLAVTPPPSIDFSVSNVSITQPAGTPVNIDENGVSIIATTTPPTANPPPKQNPVQAQAVVSVNMSGNLTNSTANVQLMLNGQVIGSASANLNQGNNSVAINFTPPTDPNLLGVLPLTAVVNNAHTVEETSYTNNSFTTNINTMVLCKVEDSGREVPFHAQTEAPWAQQAFGIPAISSGTMQKFGCSVADLYMLFSSYGINSTPIGSPVNPGSAIIPGLQGAPLDPGTLNLAMANYRTNFVVAGSVGFNEHNNPLWAGAAEVARAGYVAQCSKIPLCNPDDAISKVSFKKAIDEFANEQEAISGIQNEICNGNPVILKFGKANGGQHFMLATGVVWDDTNKVTTLRLNNPGVSDVAIGKDALYSNINQNYPLLLGGVLYRPAADPTMMFITASVNVHFVVTDPQGRRAGYDPISNKTYSEIPEASYELQSIDTPNEEGFVPETLVAERYFISSKDVLVGQYQIQVFSVSGGSYYLDYRGYDTTGTTNKSVVHSGALQVGQSEVVNILHSDQAAVTQNAQIKLHDYKIQNIQPKGSSKSNVRISGKIIPNVKSVISMDTDFIITIGDGVGKFKLQLPASVFKVKKEHKEFIYTYQSKNAEIKIKSDGDFVIEFRQVNLTGINQNDLGLVAINVGGFVGQTNANLTCNKNECSLKIKCDHHKGDRK